MKKLNEKRFDNSKNKVDVLLSFGADRELNTSLNKLIAFQIAKYKGHINQIERELKNFEARYHMTSEQFFKEFETGAMGDAAEYFEWAGLYENALLYKDRIQTLESALAK